MATMGRRHPRLLGSGPSQRLEAVQIFDSPYRPAATVEVMMALFWLSDAAWAAVEGHLPKNQPETRRVDDLAGNLGIFHVLNTGCR